MLRIERALHAPHYYAPRRNADPHRRRRHHHRRHYGGDYQCHYLDDDDDVCGDDPGRRTTSTMMLSCSTKCLWQLCDASFLLTLLMMSLTESGRDWISPSDGVTAEDGAVRAS